MTPNAMPRKGSGLTTVVRHRDVLCADERIDGPGTCCCVTREERVPAIRRGPRGIRNTALADQLKGWSK
jgi:hypothetical protein